MPDPGFNEFMFSENYKELFDKIPDECPNRTEYCYECPCMYSDGCSTYHTILRNKHWTGNVKAEYECTC
jgi:hypothetical protein